MLRVENLAASYSGIEALRGVSFHVETGEMVALIGPNGAGKSTLLNCLSGIVRPRRGTVNFINQNIAGKAAHTISRLGLLQVPEGRQILPDMSVEENLVMGELARGGRKATYEMKDVFRLFPILEERRWQRGGTLSGGQQQMLAIGRSLMAAPKVLLLDEPSLGLSPLMTDMVFAALKELNGAGLTILLVEQNAHRALGATRRAYVLEQGRLVHEGDSDGMLKDPRVIAHYLGQEPSLDDH